MRALLHIAIILIGTASGLQAQPASTLGGISDANEVFQFIQINTDSLYRSSQRISIIVLPKTQREKHGLAMAYGDPSLLPLPSMVDSSSCLAAINGGFFDVDRGGGVAYLELKDSVINRRKWADKKWRKPRSLLNGAIVWDTLGSLRIEKAKSERFYKKSDGESAVLVSGPLLLQGGESLKLPKTSFCKDRHPRSCLGERDDALILLTVDGRQEGADGMSLAELQDLLRQLGCHTAINLDGGGSTTMWIKGRGIVNSPSDVQGPRPVANILLIKE